MPQLAVIPQDEFIERYFSFSAGEHAAFIGPTGTGKTTLMMKLLPVALEQDFRLRGVVLCMKPHELKQKRANGRRETLTGDATVAEFAKVHGAKIIREWPPPELLPGMKKPAYYILWPKHSFDPVRDDTEHHAMFRKAILDCYKKGNWITVGDEAYSLCQELGLTTEMITVWSKGRSMRDAMWAATQRPTYVPRQMYSNSGHLFVWHDPDKAARQRYAEIGGVNPALVQEVTMQLNRHSCLYIRRSDRVMCIVSA